MAKEDQKPFDSLPLEIGHLNLTQKRLGLIKEVLSGQPTAMEKVGEVALAALGLLVGQRYLDESELQNELQRSTDLSQKWAIEERLRQTHAQFKARFEAARSIRNAAKQSPKDSFILDDSQFGQQVREIAERAKPIAEERVAFYQERAKRLRGK